MFTKDIAQNRIVNEVFNRIIVKEVSAYSLDNQYAKFTVNLFIFSNHHVVMDTDRKHGP